MKICFYGVGGVGGYFGAVITNHFKNRHETFFIARNKHLEAIIKDGLILKQGDKIITANPAKSTNSVDDLPICDVIILAVKSYDLEHAVKEISKISNEHTLILPLLNGVDIYERIKKHLPRGVVLPACIYIGTHIEQPGVISQKGGNCKIYMGVDPENPRADISPLLSLFKQASIHCEIQENVNTAIWSKFIFIAAYGLVTATYKKTIGEVKASTSLSLSVKTIMQEIYELARHKNIPLDDSIIESSFNKADEFPPESKTSFQRDVESKGKVNEGDLFGGTIVRLGTQLGISTPETKRVYELLLDHLK